MTVVKDADGNVLNVGDTVGFKCDIEQSGTITKIEGTTLHLNDPDGFGGEYLRYAENTTEDASRCWLEERAIVEATGE